MTPEYLGRSFSSSPRLMQQGRKVLSELPFRHLFLGQLLEKPPNCQIFTFSSSGLKKTTPPWFCATLQVELVGRSPQQPQQPASKAAGRGIFGPSCGQNTVDNANQTSGFLIVGGAWMNSRVPIISASCIPWFKKDKKFDGRATMIKFREGRLQEWTV